MRGVLISLLFISQVNAGTMASSSQYFGASGKLSVLKTGSKETSDTDANQVVFSYTVTSGKTLYLQYFSLQARRLNTSATASILGEASIELPSGTKVFTQTMTHPSDSITQIPAVVSFSEPVQVPSGTVIRIVASPATANNVLWIGNIGGYEA